MALTVTPEVYFHRHVKGTTPTLSFNISISQSGSWNILNDPKIAFTLEGEVKPEHTGAGNVSVALGLANSVNDYDLGLYPLRLRVYSPGEEKTVTVYLIVSQTADNSVFPDLISFVGIKNVQEAEPQSIYVASNNYSGIAVPSFLNVVDEDVFPNGRIIQVKPKYWFDTPDSYYSGTITINFLSGPAKLVPVEYTIKSGYDSSYSKPVHFTRDNEEMLFYKTINETTFLRLICNVLIFGYQGELKETVNLSLDLPFVENHARVNLGKEIESYIRLFENVLPMTNKINGCYPPVEVEMTAMELKYTDFSVVNQDIIPIQKFLRGRNPFSKIDEPFWLAFRPNSLRYVTENSKILLQVFKPSERSTQIIQVYLNDQLVQSLTVGVGNFNFLHPYFVYTTINVKSIGVNPGDKISFEYGRNGIFRHFLVNNPQPYSFNIAFKTIWETMDILEFTGPASFSIDYTHETSETMRNYVEVLNKMDSRHSQKVVINSGWIYKSQSFLVDELIQSRKAFLLSQPTLVENFNPYASENTGNIELIPISTKIINHESNESMISIDVEFQINKRYADESYS